MSNKVHYRGDSENANLVKRVRKPMAKKVVLLMSEVQCPTNFKNAVPIKRVCKPRAKKVFVLQQNNGDEVQVL